MTKVARDQTWKAVPTHLRNSIVTCWNLGMPPEATALYGRWWQLETWFRTLVYVELKAAYGDEWIKHLPLVTEKRQDGELELGHMTTPDAGARLAYADASTLFKVIGMHWELFSYSVLSKTVWDGRVEELLKIRNRIGHCRRPHADDLARLEQSLRDLEAGAFKALSTFNKTSLPDRNIENPVTRKWGINGEEKSHIVAHADRQYKTTFRLQYSRRPWSDSKGANAIDGQPGYIWHANWYFREGGALNLRKFWQDISENSIRDRVLFVCASDPHSLDISFPAKDDSEATAALIDWCFDMALSNWNRGDYLGLEWEQWRQANIDLDPIVQTGSPWAMVEESMAPVSIFSA